MYVNHRTAESQAVGLPKATCGRCEDPHEAIEAAERRAMSTATFVETSIVIEARYGADGLRDLDLFVARAAIDLVPVDAEQAHVARLAFGRFGRGRHPAALNFGDCFSYALARVLGAPLLYKGADFAQTDIAAVAVAAICS